MKKTNAMEKKVSQAQRSSHSNSLGRSGIAIPAPKYAIDFIDSRSDVFQRQAGKVNAPAQTNKTGLPNNLQAGVEAISGLSLEDVRVHYNSSKPVGLNALAYTHGAEIHIAPGQERHLPHEAWHVVQQKQGRVKPTLELKGQPINDETGLEREADRMGRLSAGTRATRRSTPAALQTRPQASIQRQAVIQRQTIGNLYSAHPVPTLAPNLLETIVGDVSQAAHLTRKLQPGEFMQTFGFTACTVFAIWDSVVSVASLAHFDGGVEPSDITAMVDEMIKLGATTANMQFGVVGNDYNQTIKLVWNCIDPRLNAAPLPQLSYPPPDPPIQGPANLYHGTLAFLTASGLGGE